MSNHTIKAGNAVVLEVPSDEEDAMITEAAMADPDALPFTDAEYAQARRMGRPPLPVTKPTLNMRIDADVLEALRASGRGWQTKVNAILRREVLGEGATDRAP